MNVYLSDLFRNKHTKELYRVQGILGMKNKEGVYKGVSVVLENAKKETMEQTIFHLNEHFSLVKNGEKNI